MPYNSNKPAWAVLTAREYQWVRKIHRWRLGKWNRVGLISCSATPTLRPANSHEDGRAVRLPSDGMLAVEELLSFRIFTVSRATVEDLAEVYTFGNHQGGATVSCTSR